MLAIKNAIVVLLVLFCGAAVPQERKSSSPPSIEDTVDWININVKGGFRGICDMAMLKFSYKFANKGSVLIINEEEDRKLSSRQSSSLNKSQYTVELTDLAVLRDDDIRTVSFEGECPLAGAQSLVIEMKCHKGRCINGKDKLEVVVQKDSNQKSVINAFKHLLKQGGAKESLF